MIKKNIKIALECPVRQKRFYIRARISLKMDFEIKPCRTRATYSAKPRKNVRLDLSKLKDSFKIKIETPVASVIDADGEEIIVHKYGEIKFKTCKDKDKIKKIAEEIYEKIAK